MATVIDSLLVQLKLDPKGFKAGSDEVKKESKKTKDAVAADGKGISDSVKKTETAVKSSSDGMVSSFRRVATEFIGLFVAVRSVSDVVGFFERVNASTRQLGLDSKNFGIAADELRDWQNAAVLAGGTAEGVTKTVGGLEQALFQLKYNGQFSEQLLFLSRLGVQFQTTAGQMKPFKDILFATAKAIEDRHMARPEAVQYLTAAGFDTGSINLILNGTKALQAYYDQQKKLPQTTQAEIEASTRLAQSWELLKEKLVAGAQSLLVAAEPAINSLFAAFNRGVDWLNDHQDDIARWFKSAVDWATGPGGAEIKTFFSDLTAVLSALTTALGALGSAWEHTSGLIASPLGGPFKAAKWFWDTVLGNTRGVRNNNPGNLKAVGDQPRDSGGFRIFATQEEGIAAANAQLDRYAARGINTISGIASTYAPASDNNNVAAYISALTKATGKGPNEPLGPADRQALLQGIFAHESGSSAVSSSALQGALAPNAGALAAARAAQPTPGVSPFSGPPTGATGGPSSSLYIDQMTVNTQATDAQGFARDAYGALKRKFTLAQLEPGLA
jgi:hypothetical protein